MFGHGGNSAGSYLANPTSPIPSHCASIVATSTLRVKPSQQAVANSHAHLHVGLFTCQSSFRQPISVCSKYSCNLNMGNYLLQLMPLWPHLTSLAAMVVSFSGERHNCKMGEGLFHRQQDVEKLYGGLQYCLC